MGLFDKIKDEAQKLTRHNPDAAKQAEQAGQEVMHDPGNIGQDTDAAKDMIRQQGGEQDMDTGAGAGNTTEQNQGQ
jgi:hypothetical protein